MDTKVLLQLLLKKFPELGLKAAQMFLDYRTDKNKIKEETLRKELELCGLSLEEILEFCSVTENDVELYKQYSHSEVRTAKIKVITESDEFSDAEKCERLDATYIQEKQDKNDAHIKSQENKKIVNPILAIGGVILGTLIGSSMTAGKKSISSVPDILLNKAGKILKDMIS